MAGKFQQAGCAGCLAVLRESIAAWADKDAMDVLLPHWAGRPPLCLKGAPTSTDLGDVAVVPALAVLQPEAVVLQHRLNLPAPGAPAGGPPCRAATSLSAREAVLPWSWFSFLPCLAHIHSEERGPVLQRREAALYLRSSGQVTGCFKGMALRSGQLSGL